MILDASIKDFVREHESDDIHSLALQAAKYPTVNMELAIRQIAGRKVMKDKVPAWYANEDIIYPVHLSLEQSSSEQTALYKSSLCAKAGSMADLTGGFGIDFFFLSQKFEKATYVELQTELTDIAQHNFKTLGATNVSVRNEDGVEYLKGMPFSDFIYLDPARRDKAGRKTVFIEDCTPNVVEIAPLLKEKSNTTMIKLSPMLDITLALKTLKDITDIHIVSVNNEVKELLFIMQKESSRTMFHCVNLSKTGIDHFPFYKEEEDAVCVDYTSHLNTYLYEPNSSIMKAGAYKSIVKVFSLEKLHSSSHLYTSDILYDDFPGRKFKVENICSLNKREIKEYLSDTKQANITVRNFPLSVDEIRKRTGLKDGGDMYIFATTLSDEKKVLIICRKA